MVVMLDGSDSVKLLGHESRWDEAEEPFGCDRHPWD